MKILKNIAAILAMGYLSGCSILMPYSENFACEGDAEYGKCTNVSGAYSEAVTGKPAGPTIKKDDDNDVYLDYSDMEDDGNSRNKRAKEENSDFFDDDEEYLNYTVANEEKSNKRLKKPLTQHNTEDAYLGYKNSVYRELSGLIDKPKETPMVKQPTQVRTLILSYTTQKEYKPLYMPRYVYYMLDDYMWVMGGKVFTEKNEISRVFGE